MGWSILLALFLCPLTILTIHLSAVWCYYYLDLSSGQTSSNSNHLGHSTDMCFSKLVYSSAYMPSTTCSHHSSITLPALKWPGISHSHSKVMLLHLKCASHVPVKWWLKYSMMSQPPEFLTQWSVLGLQQLGFLVSSEAKVTVWELLIEDHLPPSGFAPDKAVSGSAIYITSPIIYRSENYN